MKYIFLVCFCVRRRIVASCCWCCCCDWLLVLRDGDVARHDTARRGSLRCRETTSSYGLAIALYDHRASTHYVMMLIILISFCNLILTSEICIFWFSGFCTYVSSKTKSPFFFFQISLHSSPSVLSVRPLGGLPHSTPHYPRLKTDECGLIEVSLGGETQREGRTAAG